MPADTNNTDDFFVSGALKLIDLQNFKREDYRMHLADCVVLSHDRQILMQYRSKGWSNEGGLNLFGGHVEADEDIIDGLKREFHEELGAIVSAEGVVHLGILTEKFAEHKDAVHVYFWYDREDSITGCYEAEMRCFGSVEEVLRQPKVMDYARWALGEALKQKLI